MAAIGLAQPLITEWVLGLLQLTTSTLVRQVLTRHMAQIFVGTVSPSAVW